MQNLCFCIAKGLSLDGKGIGFEKVHFFHQKVHFSCEKRVFLRQHLTPTSKCA